MMFRTEPLGSPGVYQTASAPEFALQSERMDVCAFVGLAPRGPSRTPDLPEGWREGDGSFMPNWQSNTFPTNRSNAIAVESFEQYQRLFGGFDGPGLLPYSVSAFFAQGGQKAYIVRIVHDYLDANLNVQGVARGDVANASLSSSAPLTLIARDEGSWGNQIRAAIGFSTSPLLFEDSHINGLNLSIRTRISPGTLLRCHQPNGKPLLRFVDSVDHHVVEGHRRLVASFSINLPEPATDVEVIEADLMIDDGAFIQERHTQLGLRSDHPKWIAKHLCYHSELVYPDGTWQHAEILPIKQARFPQKAVLPNIESTQFSGGEDRYQDIQHEDFFDSKWTPAEMEASDGVHVLVNIVDLASVTIPDLYCPESSVDFEPQKTPISFASDKFETCIELIATEDPLPAPSINQLCLDPKLPADLDKIIELQKRLVDFADQQRDWVALLDVPPELRLRQTMQWRSQFDSSYAAAYGPWLNVVKQGGNSLSLKRVNPSAFAAGIIAKKENIHGVHYGPANELVNSAVKLDQMVSEAEHDQLHQSNVNMYNREPDGIRLSAARTLSRDSDVRQLNIRRFLILLKRTLTRQTQWITFEPNNAALRRQLRQSLNNYLLSLYRSGVFKGESAEHAFFVRCDEQNNPERTIEQGQLIADIGVAPAEPTEFILLRLSHDLERVSVQEQ